MGSPNSPRNRFGSTIDPASLLREWQVLDLLPISRSSLWAGVRSGKFPKPLKISANTTAWRAHDILRLIDSLGAAPAPDKPRTATRSKRLARRTYRP